MIAVYCFGLRNQIGSGWAITQEPKLPQRNFVTGAIAAGVVRKNLLLAVIAQIDMASKRQRAAVLDIAKRPLLNRA